MQSTPDTPGDPFAELYKPLADLAGDTFLTPEELAAKWKLEVQTLANQRRAGVGVPYTKIRRLVRYRLSDVVAAELRGHAGPITPEVVRLALSGFPNLSPTTREAIVARLNNLIKRGA